MHTLPIDLSVFPGRTIVLLKTKKDKESEEVVLTFKAKVVLAQFTEPVVVFILKDLCMISGDRPDDDEIRFSLEVVPTWGVRESGLVDISYTTSWNGITELTTWLSILPKDCS